MIGRPLIVLPEFDERKIILKRVDDWIEVRVSRVVWSAFRPRDISVLTGRSHRPVMGRKPENTGRQQSENRDGEQNPQRLLFESCKDDLPPPKEQPVRGSLSFS